MVSVGKKPYWMLRLIASYYLGFEISEKQLAMVIADNTGEIAESSVGLESGDDRLMNHPTD